MIIANVNVVTTTNDQSVLLSVLSTTGRISCSFSCPPLPVSSSPLTTLSMDGDLDLWLEATEGVRVFVAAVAVAVAGGVGVKLGVYASSWSWSRFFSSSFSSLEYLGEDVRLWLITTDVNFRDFLRFRCAGPHWCTCKLHKTKRKVEYMRSKKGGRREDEGTDGKEWIKDQSIKCGTHLFIIIVSLLLFLRKSYYSKPQRIFPFLS